MKKDDLLSQFPGEVHVEPFPPKLKPGMVVLYKDNSPYTRDTKIKEARLFDVSPSGEYVKFEGEWVNVKEKMIVIEYWMPGEEEE